MGREAHPFVYPGAGSNNVLKKYRALLVILVVLFAGMFVCGKNDTTPIPIDSLEFR